MMLSLSYRRAGWLPANPNQDPQNRRVNRRARQNDESGVARTFVAVEPEIPRRVIGYYSMLHRKPLGKFHVQVCTNIACQAVGGEELYEHASRSLGLKNKQVSADGLVSLEEVECMGACSWAPAIQINYDFHHFVTPERFDQLIRALQDGTYRKAS